MTDSENDERRRKLVAQLRDRHSLPLVRLLAACAQAADEIERLNAECVSRINAYDIAFRQAMSNGESADNLRRELEQTRPGIPGENGRRG